MPRAIVDGPDAMRQKVRELFRAGADVIKVATSGGVLSPRDDPRHGHFRDDELEVLVAEATAAGKYVMAHAQATDGIKAAIRTGIRSIEHGIYLDDEAIQMMLDRGTFLVPTLSAPRGVFAARDAGIPVPDVFIKKCEMVIEVHTESIRRAIEAGVKVAMGTDSGVCPHGQNAARARADGRLRDVTDRRPRRHHAHRRRPARRRATSSAPSSPASAPTSSSSTPIHSSSTSCPTASARCGRTACGSSTRPDATGPQPQPSRATCSSVISTVDDAIRTQHGLGLLQRHDHVVPLGIGGLRDVGR